MEKKTEASFLIKQISEKFDKRINQDLKEFNLTCSQMRVMHILRMNGGNTTLSQKDLEDILQVSHPTVVRILSGVEEKGLVKCVFDSSDKRVKNVYLTQRADDVFEWTDARRKSLHEEIFKSFEEGETEELLRLLKKLRDSLGSNECGADCRCKVK